MECRDSNQVNWVPCNPIENSHLKEKRETVIKALRSKHNVHMYKELSSLGYCPYILFVYSFVPLMFFWTVISITLTVC